ncbi:MAG: hypothetical protein ABIL14_01440 [candidate division WOR-3 bacterium]
MFKWLAKRLEPYLRHEHPFKVHSHNIEPHDHDLKPHDHWNLVPKDILQACAYAVNKVDNDASLIGAKDYQKKLEAVEWACHYLRDKDIPFAKTDVNFGVEYCLIFRRQMNVPSDESTVLALGQSNKET